VTAIEIVRDGNGRGDGFSSLRIKPKKFGRADGPARPMFSFDRR
jgi:hypothetical protein